MKIGVYGTLKRGYRNNRLLQDATFIGEATTGLKFQMRCVGFPAVLPATSANPGLPVRLEIYEVNRQTLARLDSLEQNGRMYNRRRTRYRVDGKPAGRAWVYIGGKAFDQARNVVPENGQYVWPDAEHWLRKEAI